MHPNNMTQDIVQMFLLFIQHEFRCKKGFLVEKKFLLGNEEIWQNASKCEMLL